MAAEVPLPIFVALIILQGCLRESFVDGIDAESYHRRYTLGAFASKCLDDIARLIFFCRRI